MRLKGGLALGLSVAAATAGCGDKAPGPQMIKDARGGSPKVARTMVRATVVCPDGAVAIVRSTDQEKPYVDNNTWPDPQVDGGWAIVRVGCDVGRQVLRPLALAADASASEGANSQVVEMSVTPEDNGTQHSMSITGGDTIQLDDIYALNRAAVAGQ